MTIEGVVFDVGGTLVTSRGEAQPRVSAALGRLHNIGVQLIAAGNHPRRDVLRDLRSAELLQDLDLVASKTDVGANKGSPAWIEYICAETGLAPNQLLYVGDSHYDMVTALQGSVVYAHAGWSNNSGEYGLNAPAPGWVPAVIEHIFRKRHLWYWSLDAFDGLGRPVWVRTLLDSRGAGDIVLQRALINAFKSDASPQVGSMTLREFVMLHMLASLYASDIPACVRLWTTYPGSTGEQNRAMGDFIDMAAKLFYRRYDPDLFVRHRPALRSRDAYKNGGAVGAFRNQLDTVLVAPSRRKKIAGNGILVVDNYITRGASVESARNLLLNAEAEEVFIAGVGKYEFGYHIATLMPHTGDCAPVQMEGEAFDLYIDEQRGVKNPEALKEFHGSYFSMHAERW